MVSYTRPNRNLRKDLIVPKLSLSIYMDIYVSSIFLANTCFKYARLSAGGGERCLDLLNQFLNLNAAGFFCYFFLLLLPLSPL